MRGAVGGGLFGKALATGSATSATAVMGAYPALVAVFNYIVLGEPLNTNQVLGVALAVGSVLAFAVG